jgi:hypothetical protein
MKFRALPKSILVYTFADSKRCIEKSLRDNVYIAISAALVTLCLRVALVPYYFIGHLIASLYNAARYCTYSLNDKEEAAVAMILRNRRGDNEQSMERRTNTGTVLVRRTRS